MKRYRKDFYRMYRRAQRLHDIAIWERGLDSELLARSDEIYLRFKKRFRTSIRERQ